VNLYLLTRRGGMPQHSWDEWISAVVAAETAEDAVTIHPGGGPNYWAPGEMWVPVSEVDATLIGVAVAGTSTGVVHNSYNAG
jgi:hypothetical protein